MAEPARWPLLLDQADACAFTKMTRAQFGALVQAGIFPPAREPIPGSKRWHRKELEQAADKLWQIEKENSLEQARAESWRALDSFDPVAASGAHKGRGRSDVPVLQARRPADRASGS